MIKYIVMDIDGTLLNSKNEISEKTKEILISFQKNGGKLILASGRSYQRLLPIASQLCMNRYGGFLIEVDGIGFYNIETEKREILKEMNLLEVQSLIQYLMSLDCEVQVCEENAIYAYIPERLIPIKEKIRKERNLDKDFPWTSGPWDFIFDMRKAYSSIYYFEDCSEIKGKIRKIQIMDYETHIQEVFQSLNKTFKNQFEFFRTSYRQIEILPFGYSKGKTLKHIMKLNHIHRNEILSFGEGENDVSLFEQTEKSYAMGQAKEYVKQHASHITKSNNEDGIYYALKKEGF